MEAQRCLLLQIMLHTDGVCTGEVATHRNRDFPCIDVGFRAIQWTSGLCVCCKTERERYGRRFSHGQLLTTKKEQFVAKLSVLRDKQIPQGAEKGRDGFTELLLGWGKKHRMLGISLWLPTRTVCSQLLLLLGKENPSSNKTAILPREGITTSGVNPDSPKPHVVSPFRD